MILRIISRSLWITQMCVVFAFILLLLLFYTTNHVSAQSLKDIRLCRDAAFAIPKPSNGQLMACCRYSKMKFRCSKGYQLIDGDEIVSCRKGRIYGKFPRCVSVRKAKCGRSDFDFYGGRIVGGQRSKLAEWPWMAVVYLDNSIKCGGTLISDSHVLTAAHCIYDMFGNAVTAPQRFSVVVGAINYRTPGNQSVKIPVSRTWIHQSFSLRTFKNDIALLKLKDSVTFTRNRRPICFPGDDTELATRGRTSFIAGWGRTAQQTRTHGRGHSSEILRYADMPITSDSRCSAATRPSEPYDVKSMLCAGTGKGLVDSCNGDSGGPLMVFDRYKTKKGKLRAKWSIAGIVSWGDGCALPGTYGYYTRVSSYVKWVRDKIAY